MTTHAMTCPAIFGQVIDWTRRTVNAAPRQDVELVTRLLGEFVARIAEVADSAWARIRVAELEAKAAALEARLVANP